MDDKNKKDNEIEEKTEKEIKAEDTAVVEEGSVEGSVEDSVEEEVLEEDKNEEEKIPAKKLGFDDFRVGDTLRIFYKIIEGDKLRTQPYEGIVISKRGEGMSKSFTVRRIGADGVGIERIFPAFSPNIDNLKLIKKGKVRRAKLYYLRKKIGRAAMRIKEIK